VETAYYMTIAMRSKFSSMQKQQFTTQV